MQFTPIKNCSLLPLMFFVITVLSILFILTCTNDYDRNTSVNYVEQFENIQIRKCELYLKHLDSINHTLQWKPLKCGLWKNKIGEIGFKTSRVICSDGQVIADTYITRFGFNENPPLQDIIDTSTFQELGNTYYKDKNHIYHHYAVSDGGSFYIFEQVDYATFQIIGDCYAKDKNYIFDSRSGQLTNVDYKTFKTKKGLGVCLAKDKNGYIVWDERVTPEELVDEYIKKAIEELEK